MDVQPSVRRRRLDRWVGPMLFLGLVRPAGAKASVGSIPLCLDVNDSAVDSAVHTDQSNARGTTLGRRFCWSELARDEAVFRPGRRCGWSLGGTRATRGRDPTPLLATSRGPDPRTPRNRNPCFRSQMASEQEAHAVSDAGAYRAGRARFLGALTPNHSVCAADGPVRGVTYLLQHGQESVASDRMEVWCGGGRTSRWRPLVSFHRGRE